MARWLATRRAEALTPHEVTTPHAPNSASVPPTLGCLATPLRSTRAASDRTVSSVKLAPSCPSEALLGCQHFEIRSLENPQIHARL